jgi:NAD(P)-dependent dehydrogenase (short-subunit alcohol dehydrogenase family)
MSGRIKGKTAIVTGAAQGIGKAVAIALAKEGANIVVSDVQVEAGESVAEQIRRSGATAQFVKADVELEENCSNLVEESLSLFGKFDVLVNNAGYFPRSGLEETSTDLWEKVLRINLRGPFYCAKYAVPAMRRSGGGSIVNIGSINGIQALPELVAYGAAKGGLLALTRTLANACSKDRIRVNYVIPGWVLTEGEIAIQRAQGVSLDELEKIGRKLPLGRFQTPEDTAYAVVYLASDESAQVTGTILHLDAGASTLPLQRVADYS